MSRENVEIVLAATAALNRGDFDAAFKDTVAQTEIDMSRAVGLDRSVYSVSQFRRLAKEFAAGWESVRYEFGEVIEAGDHVVTPFANVLSGRDGIEVLAHGTWLWTIRGGAIIHMCLYQERQEALKAVGL